MPRNEPGNSRPETEPSGSLLRRFLFRRRVYVGLAMLLLYALFGFFAVPALITKYGIENIERITERPVRMGEVRFNPFTFDLEIYDFELDDSDGTALASFEELHLDFQLSSLFRWAWSFREFRVVEPAFFDERFAAEDTRLGRMLDTIKANTPPAEETSDDSGLPRLYVEHLVVAHGDAAFLDHLPEPSVKLSTGPININVHGLSTLPDRDGSNTVHVRFPSGAELDWRGEFRLAPVQSTGTLSLENWELDPLLPYLQSMLPLDTLSAKASTRADYRFELSETGDPTLRLENIESRLDEFSVSGLEPASEFLAFDALELLGGTLSYPEQAISFQEIRLSKPRIDAWLDEDAQPGLLQLLPEASAEPAAAPESSEWDITVGRFSLEGGRLALSDRSITPHAAVDVENLSVALENIDNRDGTRIPLTAAFATSAGGQLKFDGSVTILPEPLAGGTATVTGLPAALAEPYLQQSLLLNVDSGSLDLTAELNYAPAAGLTSVGEMQITELQASDIETNQPLMSCEKVEIDRFELYLDRSVARLSSLRLDRPYGRVEVRSDRSTNIDSLLVETAENAEVAEATPAWSVVIGGIAVDDGAMDFSDYSLPLQFATYITSLDGTVSTIDTASTEPADIRLEGQVDEFGLARIDGGINVMDPTLDADVTVEFRNLAMNNLSPYSAGFAGREIDAGKLDLDLRYLVKQGILDGQNKIVLRDLELGDSVDSPDAVSLPLDLAVALLKNSEGVIDVDLPVEGDINDPEFRIGGVIWKAFTTLITKVVTAPFKLLGSLIGVDSEDFGQVQFLAGRSDLTPPELERIAQLREALDKRPELSLEISGVYDTATDTPALQFFSLRDTVFQRMGREIGEASDSNELLDDEIRSVLEEMHRERFPDEPLEPLRALHSAPPAGDPEGEPVVDRTAYSGELVDRLLPTQPVGAAELEQLAAQRAQAILDAMLEQGMPPERARIVEPQAVESEDGEWVVTELGVATGSG